MTDSKQIMAALSLIVAISGSVVFAQSPQAALPVTAIPAQAVEDPSVQAGWKRYEIGAKPTFSVILPAAPGVTVETVQGQQVNTYVSANASAVYAVVRIDKLPADLERASEEARSKYFRSFFQGFAQGFQKGMGPTVKDPLELLDVTQVTTATGRNGYQQRLALGTTQGRGQMVFVGNSAFGLVALWFPNAPAADNESFFRSFRLR